MRPDDIRHLFQTPGGGYAFARWSRPVAPVAFGVEAETLPFIKGAVKTVATIAGRTLADTDPESGANLVFFFLRDWPELLDVPEIGGILDAPAATVARLTDADALHFRSFRFDDEGAIRAAFVFVKMDHRLAPVPAETLALEQAVRVALLWSPAAFADRSPLLQGQAGVLVRPEIAALVRAAHDPVMPDTASDPAHALRLAARMKVVS